MNKNLFDRSAADEILQRIFKLNADSKPLWGKMNVSQMLAHCQIVSQIALGDTTLKKSFMGFLFGKIAKRQLMKEQPFKQGLPTAPEFIVKDSRNFEAEKQKLEVLVHRFVAADQEVIAKNKHPFFGNLTAGEWGILNYKHLDHHLRQFGA